MNASKRNISVLLLGCLFCALVFAGQGASRKTFEHKHHMEELGECTACHDTTAKSLPALKTEACLDCHDEGPPPYRLPVASRRLKIRFPHSTHAEALECLDCHKKTLEGKQVAGLPLVDQPGCVACHEKNDVDVPESQCSKCHGVDQRKEPPASHSQSWRLKHGNESQRRFVSHGQDCKVCHQKNECQSCHKTSKPQNHTESWRTRAHGLAAEFSKIGQDCMLCHQRNACQTCHKTSKPQNHTGLWRMRTHGVSAEWNRESCRTCHETGVCVQCHQTNEPANHSGAWKSTHGLAAQTKTNQSCAACHSLSWCAACHQGGA